MVRCWNTYFERHVILLRKIAIVILTIGVSSGIRCTEQKRLAIGEVKGSREMYDIVRMKPMFNEPETTIIVSSKRNKFNKGIPPNKDPNALPMNKKTEMKVDTGAIRSIVYNTLASQLAQLKQNHEKISLDLIFLPTGDISDINFFLNKNTILTITEIEEIDLRLRENIKAKFSGKYYLNEVAIRQGRGLLEYVF